MRLLCLTLTVVIALSQTPALQCDNGTCPATYVNPSQRGDGLCDLKCNIELCNFDRGNATTSDCYSDCLETGCSSSLLGNGDCDLGCNNEKCGWDQGDCGYCAKNCYEEKLGNGVCNAECNNAQCLWDWEDCVSTR